MDKIKELEQKINRTGQFHLDAINEKFAKLEKNANYKKLWQENTKDYNELARKRLDDYTKGVENSKKIDVLEKKIDNMLMLEQDIDRKIFARMDSIDNKIDSIHEDIDVVAEDGKEDINEVNFRITRLEENSNKKALDIAFKESAEDYNALESKYYKLRSELDAVYKVLEMDALDIQDLYNKLENHPKKDDDRADIPLKKHPNNKLDNKSYEDRYTLDCDNKEGV